MRLLKGLHHAAVRCCGKTEMDSVIAFYCDKLGMEKVRRWGDGADAGAMLDTGLGIVELFANAEPG